MEQSNKLSAGEITKEEYDKWRYNYPNSDDSIHWAKVPSKGLSDMLLAIEKEEEKKSKSKKKK